eukprot:292238-Chlamydomonas_euryale.AAC.1
MRGANRHTMRAAMRPANQTYSSTHARGESGAQCQACLPRDRLTHVIEIAPCSRAVCHAMSISPRRLPCSQRASIQTTHFHAANGLPYSQRAAMQPARVHATNGHPCSQQVCANGRAGLRAHTCMATAARSAAT